MCLHCLGYGLREAVTWLGFTKYVCGGMLQVGSSMTQPLVMPMQPQPQLGTPYMMPQSYPVSTHVVYNTWNSPLDLLWRPFS